MAENKKSFIAYVDWKETFESLPDEKAGQLVKHLFAYVSDENPKSDDILINAVFANIKQQLKRDLIKWKDTSSQRAEIGRIGGVKSGEVRRSKRSNCFNPEAKRSKTKQNEHDTVNVNDNVIDNDIKKKEIEEIFNFFNTTSFAKIQKVTNIRKSHIGARIKEFSYNDVITVITKADKSDFLHGKNKNKWTANFDWIINPQNFIKIMEGNYDNKPVIRMLA